MTLDELLDECRGFLAKHDTHPSWRRITQAVIDMLGEALPCDFDLPVVCTDCVEVVCDSELVYQFTSAEARAYAAALLRAADQLDANDAQKAGR